MQFLSIGECMIEMSGDAGGNWRMGFAGDTLNTLWYARAGLDPANGPVGFLTGSAPTRFPIASWCFFPKTASRPRPYGVCLAGDRAST